jgi:hypothetical protein
LRNHDDGRKVDLSDVPIDPLDDGLGGVSVGGHIVTAFVIAGENPADLAGLDFWLDCPNNFLKRFLPCQGSITTIILAKNNLCDGLITQMRSNSNLKTRCKGLEGDVGIAKMIGGIVSTLVTFTSFEVSACLAAKAA